MYLIFCIKSMVVVLAQRWRAKGPKGVRNPDRSKIKQQHNTFLLHLSTREREICCYFAFQKLTQLTQCANQNIIAASGLWRPVSMLYRNKNIKNSTTTAKLIHNTARVGWTLFVSIPKEVGWILFVRLDLFLGRQTSTDKVNSTSAYRLL